VSGPVRTRGRWRVALRWLPLAVLVAASVAAIVSGAYHLLSLDRLLESRAWLHAAVAEDRPRAILLGVLFYVGAVVLSVPATLVLTIVYGFLFGVVTGALVAVTSATTGAAIVFTIGRAAAADLLRRRAGPRLATFAEGFRRDAFSYILLLRLLPLFPFWMTNLGPAVFGVRLRSFVLATFLGLLPGAFIYAATGSGIEDVVAAHESARAECLAGGGSDCENALTLRSLVTPKLVAGLGSLAGLVALSMAIRRRAGRRRESRLSDAG